MRTAFTLLFIYLCFVFVTEGDELITKNVGLPSDSKLMAFGDFNSDKKTDLFFVKDKYTLQVYLWSGGQFATTDDLTFTHSLEITNIVPGDFNHDGKVRRYIVDSPHEFCA